MTTHREASRVLPTAAGPMYVAATAAGIVHVDRAGPEEMSPGSSPPDGVEGHDVETHDDVVHDPAAGAAGEHLARFADQLKAYMEGRLRAFDVPVDWDGAGVHDEFAREVYREIREIPYGETATYGQISHDAGRPRNARRVGRLCALVPVSFLIPVHRVIRADGGLGACPEFRLRLLEHERRNTSSSSPRAYTP